MAATAGSSWDFAFRIGLGIAGRPSDHAARLREPHLTRRRPGVSRRAGQPEDGEVVPHLHALVERSRVGHSARVAAALWVRDRDLRHTIGEQTGHDRATVRALRAPLGVALYVRDA